MNPAGPGAVSGAPGRIRELTLYKRQRIPILRRHLRQTNETGGVAEWSKAAVLKTAERELRGFESLLLRRAALKTQ